IALLPTGSLVDTKSCTIARSTSRRGSSCATAIPPVLGVGLALAPTECQVSILRSMLTWHSVGASASPTPSTGGIAVAHDEPRLEVLRAIVQDFVSTNDPVGSKAI